MLDPYLNKFKQSILDIPYYHKGIWKNEAFILCSLCDILKIDLMIESGFCNGLSAELFCRYGINEVISLDICPPKYIDRIKEAEKRLSKYKNFKLIKGNSVSLLPGVIEKHKNKRIGLFIDGPKGKQAFNLALKSYKYPNVYLVAVHDDKNRLLSKYIRSAAYSYDSNFLKYIDILCNDEKKFIDKGTNKRYREVMPNGPGLSFAIKGAF